MCLNSTFLPDRHILAGQVAIHLQRHHQLLSPVYLHSPPRHLSLDLLPAMHVPALGHASVEIVHVNVGPFELVDELGHSAALDPVLLEDCLHFAYLTLQFALFLPQHPQLLLHGVKTDLIAVGSEGLQNVAELAENIG